MSSSSVRMKTSPKRPDIERRYAGMYHLLTWPQISFVAEDEKGRIVGYVLAKMCVLSMIVSRFPHAHLGMKKKTRMPTPLQTLLLMVMSIQYPSYGRTDD